MRIKFELERETKNTMRFNEVVPSQLDAPNIGVLYVQKNALKKIGYKEGQVLVINLSTEEEN